MPPHCIIFGVVLQEILFQPAVLYFNKILGLWLFNNDIWVILMSYNFNFLKILLSGFPIFQPPPPHPQFLLHKIQSKNYFFITLNKFSLVPSLPSKKGSTFLARDLAADVLNGVEES